MTEHFVDHVGYASLPFVGEIGSESPWSSPLAPIRVPSAKVADDYLLDNIQKFQTWLSEAPIKSSTRKVYLSRAKQYITFLRQNKITLAMQDTDFTAVVNAFLMHGKYQLNFKPTTINNFITMFRQYAKSCGEPFIAPDFEPIPAKRLLTSSEEERFEATVHTCASVRDRALVILFLKTDADLISCSNLKTSDLCWDERSLFIRLQSQTKRKIVRIVPEDAEHIRAWLAARSFVTGSDTPYLFLNRSGKKLSLPAISAALRKLGWKARLRLSAQVLRNCYKAKAIFKNELGLTT